MVKAKCTMKTLVICFSYHHNNTQKIAEAIAKVLDARIKIPRQTNLEELEEYDLIGFGSGIYSGRHHEDLLNLADRLSITTKKAFIFSTSGVKSSKFHSLLIEKLQAKGYIIVGEFSCKGFNTNSFLKLFGGMNKGRPNAEDLKRAEEFAMNLKQNMQKT
jgi:flavodoxin